MTHRVIIAEPDPIVSFDLEGMLKGTPPNGEVLVANDPAGAAALLQDAGTEALMFVRASWLVKHAELAARVTEAAESGCRIVTLGKIKGLSPAFGSVEVPFTTEMIMQAVYPSTRSDIEI